MRKKDNKIYKTLDYIQFVWCFCVFFILTVLVLGVFITLAIVEKEVGVVYVVMSLLYGGVLVPVSIYYGYKLFSALYHSDSYVYIVVPSDEFTIDKESLWGFKERVFALKVTVDGKEYVSDKVLNARFYAEAQEEKKIEIGVDAARNRIVIVKPTYAEAIDYLG